MTELLVGQYGLWTMGMTYALALILPIVTTFFLAFGVLEDSGYLPRLSVIANRLFALIGLNGRAVLPMVLGLGCVTMATLTTRILHSPRERLITVFLLALAIPCSAQLGVVLGMLGSLSFTAVLIWALAMVGILMLAGFLAAADPRPAHPAGHRTAADAPAHLRQRAQEDRRPPQVVPDRGHPALPGRHLPDVRSRQARRPAGHHRAGEPLVSGWLGLPKEASAAFVMGFLRRDFGATGLFAMADALNPIQAVVGMITITLFIPCFASLMMMVKEQGMKTAARHGGPHRALRLPGRRPVQYVAARPLVSP
jgi:ferrous iron transport protein B